MTDPDDPLPWRQAAACEEPRHLALGPPADLGDVAQPLHLGRDDEPGGVLAEGPESKVGGRPRRLIAPVVGRPLGLARLYLHVFDGTASARRPRSSHAMLLRATR